MFKLLVVLLASLAFVYAGPMTGHLQPKPEKFKNQEGCYIKDLDKVIPYGISIPSKTFCMEIRCGTRFITYVSCGSVATEPPCVIEKDTEKLYPECCPRIVCP